MKNPTDLQILNLIYNTYYKEFKAFSKKKKNRETKNYVPIDIDLIGNKLDIDGDIIFSRLYYDLKKRYRYDQKDGSKVEFFSLRVEDDVHCIHFPYMASVLANLRYENKKFKTATTISLVSLGIAFVSVSISLLLFFQP